ncbi:uncharacterized protein LOC124434497 isoform X2 [Xenia sp. Carnegie-2017]|uniref:uncharacterized protein LOC124434497 isoform X2 n=1 Tax=Xenia sp. Carnegie-2017 TaxID=2897299 RepID=UPI001F03CF03|nr:uncharacterized protein LOC124434497 isoform X2 [Xenia sp. Carnegie-2017]
MFAPIAPANEAMNKQDDVMTVIQDSDVDVQPLLDSVIPHQTVKGAVTLKDIEGKEDAPIDGADKKVPDLADQQGSQVFHKLVETMKASGNLPEKPTPTIPDLPPHLLPRPPSSKDKSRSVQKSRTPSPRQLLQEVIRRTQSPTAFVNHTLNEENREVSYGRMRAASPLAEMLSPGANASPLSPRDLYGSSPVFSINGNDDGLLVITGATKDTEKKSKNRNIPSRYGKEVENSSVNLLASTSDNKPSNSAVISQAFVPTSVLRKLHCDKHDLLSESRITNKPSTDQRNISSDDLSAVEEREGLYNSVNKSAFTSPKTNTDIQPELFTPHRLPLPTSPSVTPLSLPLPQTPLVGRTSETFTKNPSKPFNTPHSLPLPRSPLVSNANTTPPSDFGIRPLLKSPSSEDSVRVRGRSQRKPSDQRQNHNLKRFQHNQLPYGAMNIMPRPGALPAPFNLNAVRAMNVHPTALALALRNQQYQMARAAAVAAANAVVNRPVISPAQAAAALMFNQQRIAGAFRGVMPQLNPRMIHNNVPRRPNLPPALQRQHHVVHHSGDHMKDKSSLSKWFSDAVLSQTPSQAPSRGAKVLSVEELERHS